MLGALPSNPDSPKLPAKYVVNKVAAPDSFDSRDNWPNCKTIGEIRDQSACGSCWAFGAVEAMSDRLCIGKNLDIRVSAQHMVSCCTSCGMGCNGGYPSSAWSYWVKNGLVSEECYPYAFKSCDHHVPDSKNTCPPTQPTPPCKAGKCDSSSGKDWASDLRKGSKAYSIYGGESAIMTEIMEHGPVEAAFEVYSDFLNYKSGIYQHKSGSYVGGHAVKMLGWGVENGVKYWIIANSWNPHWGENGLFRILKGSDHCGIESEIAAGLA